MWLRNLSLNTTLACLVMLTSCEFIKMKSEQGSEEE